MDQHIAEAISAAASRPQVLQAVSDFYAQVMKEIDSRKPVCLVSGRCCRFDEYGHRLYVTPLELAHFIAHLPDLNAKTQINLGGCPFQSSRLCTVHSIRPFGCRLFFCDATSTDWQREQYEHFHARLKELHEELDVPYAYVEWREALSDWHALARFGTKWHVFRGFLS